MTRLALLLAVLLLPLAGAQPDWSVDGDATLAIEALGMILEQEWRVEGRAAAFDGTIYEADYGRRIVGASSGRVVDNSTTSGTDASIRLTPRDNAVLGIFPVGSGLRLDTAITDAHVDKASEPWELHRRVEVDRPPFVVAAKDAWDISWTGSTFRLQGDALLVVWSHGVDVAMAGQRHSWTTGAEFQDPIMAPLGVAVTDRHVEREMIVLLRDADLRLHGPQDTVTVRASAAQATAGNVPVQLRGADDVQVLAPHQTARLGTGTDAWATEPSTGADASWWMVGLLAVGGFSVAVPAAVAHAARGLDPAMAEHRFRSALRRSRLLRLSPPHREDALMAGAVALIALAKWHRAGRWLSRSRRPSAAQDYLWTHIHWADGDEAAARDAFERAMAKDPSLLEHALADPTIRPLARASLGPGAEAYS